MTLPALNDWLTLLADNTQGDITAADLRSIVTDIHAELTDLAAKAGNTKVWKLLESKTITAGSTQSYQFTGIPDTVEKIEVWARFPDNNNNRGRAGLRLGYGATPTILVGNVYYQAAAAATFFDVQSSGAANNDQMWRFTLQKLQGTSIWMLQGAKRTNTTSDVVALGHVDMNGNAVSALEFDADAYSGSGFWGAGQIDVYVYDTVTP